MEDEALWQLSQADIKFHQHCASNLSVSSQTIDLITTRRGSYRQAACDIATVVLEVDLGRVNQSR